jgi:hypothetical protein
MTERLIDTNILVYAYDVSETTVEERQHVSSMHEGL